jgi:hypothetical protein
MATSKFRSKVWDPILIISQIISIQFQFYTSLLLLNYFWTIILNNIFGMENVQYSLSQIFDHRQISFKTTQNTFVCLTFLLNSILRFVFRKIFFLFYCCC